MKRKDNTTVKFFARHLGPLYVTIYLAISIIFPLCWIISGEPVTAWWIDILFEIGFVVYLIMVIFFKNYLTVITITPEYIRVKRREYTWNDICVVLRSGFINRSRIYYVYFSDKYITEEDTDKYQFKKNGTYFMLYPERAESLLQHYPKKVKILDEPDGVLEEEVWKIVQEHNDKIEKASI